VKPGRGLRDKEELDSAQPFVVFVEEGRAVSVCRLVRYAADFHVT
jgi:hypothetical protein